MLRALGSASCDITLETGDTICYGHWILHLVISHTRHGYDLVWALGFASCDITDETGGTILFRAFGSASCDITNETGVRLTLRLVISHTRQEVRFVAGIGFCVL